MLGLGLILMVIGVILWLTVAPALGGALIVIGAIVAIVGAVLGHRNTTL